MRQMLGPVLMWTAITAVVIYVVNRLLDKLSPEAIAKGLKEGASAAADLGLSAGKQVKKTTDDVVTVATGREETLGGWLAEWLDPDTRRVREMLSTPAYIPARPKEEVQPQQPTKETLKPTSSWWRFWE